MKLSSPRLLSRLAALQGRSGLDVRVTRRHSRRRLRQLRLNGKPVLPLRRAHSHVLSDGAVRVEINLCVLPKITDMFRWARRSHHKKRTGFPTIEDALLYKSWERLFSRACGGRISQREKLVDPVVATFEGQLEVCWYARCRGCMAKVAMFQHFGTVVDCNRAPRERH